MHKRIINIIATLLIMITIFFIYSNTNNNKTEANPAWCTSSQVISCCAYKGGQHDCPWSPTPLESDCQGLACNHLQKPFDTSCVSWQSYPNTTGSDAKFMITKADCSGGSHIVVVASYNGYGVYTIHHCANLSLGCLQQDFDGNQTMYYYIKKLTP